MSDRRRGLGRGLGALIPTAPVEPVDRPSDVFFPERTRVVPRETAANGDEATRDASVARDLQGAALGGAALRPSPATVDDGSADGPSVGRGRDLASRLPGDTPAPVAAERPAAEHGGLKAVPGAEFAEIPVDLIRPNPKQPRTVFDPDELAELVASIREIGVLQPVVVRRIDDAAPSDASEGSRPQYELVMGERRWRASREAGNDTVPAIVRATSDDDLLRDALLENLHRSQLNPLEEAAAYQQLLDDFGCTHDELANRIGRSRPQISNTLRLLRLPPLVARRLAAGVLSAGHARALLGLDDAAAMERLAQRIVAEGLSVRSVEEIVALGGDRPRPQRRPRQGGDQDGRLDDLAASLSDRFDTRVSVAMGRRKGKLTVEFATMDDLDRIVELLGGAPR